MIPRRGPVRVLLVEDNPGDARLIREMLREPGASGASVDLTHAERLRDGLRQLGASEESLEVVDPEFNARTEADAEADRGPDVILLDLSLPDSRGLDTFTTMHAAAPETPVVVLSGLDDEELAVRAVQEGAQDYLVKGQVDGAALTRSIRYAIERQRLESARRELERQRDELFSSVSHDLRTPVAAIKAAIGVVRANEPPDMPPALHRLLANVEESADELSALINDLLEIARLRAGRVELWPTEVDLREVVERAAHVFEPLIQARHQTLELHLPTTPVLASVDVERFGRVLRNLIGNAQKYGREGGHIRVSLSPPGREVCVSVADDGPGIAPEDRKRVFERFQRAGSAGSTPGTGLGLAIARGFVELHGGRIWVESNLGQGSTFHVRLPVVPSW